MKRFIITCAALVIGISLTVSVVRSQEKKPPAADTVTAQGHDEEQMMANARPGPEHARLAKLAGDWTYTSKLTMPGQPPQESSGTSKMTMTLDGRFLHEQSTGQMMGMPVTGARVMGFNNATKNYESLWTWTMSTGMLILKGPSPDGGKTVNMEGGFDDVDGHQKMVVTLKMISDDHFTYELGHGDPGGAVMTIDYQRKK